MKNKGFTLVELITTFALSAVIIVLLINVIILIKNVYYKASIKTELYINQSNLSNALNSKLKHNMLSSYEECDDTEFCYIFNFINEESIKLKVSESKITFGNFVYKLNDKTKVVNPTLINNYIDISETNGKNLLNLKVPIINEFYPDINFGINLVYAGIYNDL